MARTAAAKLLLIRAKIERAKKNLRLLEVDLAAFRGREKYAVVFQEDPETGQRYYPLPSAYPVISLDALPATGDVIHNLRSALDHLAYQLVIVGLGRAPTQEEARRIEFPIAKDAPTYETEKIRKVKGMRPEAIKAIDALKPYKGGNDPLWRIHKLNNIDKHRVLLTVGRDVLCSAEWFDSPHPAFPEFYLPKASDPPFNGVFEVEMENDMELEIEKAGSKAEISHGDPLLPTLHQLVDFVDNLVPKFLPLLD